MPTSSHSKQILTGNLNTESCLVHVTFFSNVLNSDVNIVNIALIALCSLAVAKLAHWPISRLLLGDEMR